MWGPQSLLGRSPEEGRRPGAGCLSFVMVDRCALRGAMAVLGAAPHLRPPEAQGVARQVSAGALGPRSSEEDQPSC